MNKNIKRILIVLAFIFIVGQFITPTPNTSEGPYPNDISTLTDDKPALAILKRSCYDCHSDNTNYPWYSKVFPVSWYMYNHVEGGRKKLNFSQFATYDVKRRNHKLDEIKEFVENGNMPLSSYERLHSEAKLSQDEKEKIYAWVENMSR